MPSTLNETVSKQRLRPNLDIPVDALDDYERLAKVEKKTLDRVLSERLTDCVGHNAQKGLWFGDPERQRLEAALGHNVSSPEEVISLVERAIQIKVGNIEIPLGLPLAERLRSRCWPYPFDQWLRDQVLNKLNGIGNLG